MKPLTREWVEKAEGDYASALRELRARKTPNYDSACFHAQQCIEKYLKACLQEKGIAFGRTHDLSVLLDLVPSKKGHFLELLRPNLRALSAFAVEFRYPGESADKIIASQAVKTCGSARMTFREWLGLGV
jgi:HEPN domain-containing protein